MVIPQQSFSLHTPGLSVMPPAQRRADEADRLRTLLKAHILDTPPEKEYDDIVKMLSHLSGFPIALVSLVEEHRQWFKAKACTFSDETARTVSFCDHVVESREMLVVHDAATHPAFSDNPLVLGEPGIRCYIGYPIIPSSTEHCLGALCCIDTVPHEEITEDVLTHIACLGNLVSALIDRNLKIVSHEEKTNLFVAKISHELRTPLHGILGFARLLKESFRVNNTIGEEENEHVDNIASCATGNLR